jgi:hypothetical protein
MIILKPINTKETGFKDMNHESIYYGDKVVFPDSPFPDALYEVGLEDGKPGVYMSMSVGCIPLEECHHDIRIKVRKFHSRKEAEHRICICEDDRNIVLVTTLHQHPEFEELHVFYCPTCNSHWNEL